MSNNLIVGLGGTGAKVIESFIHLCASGLGPDAASIAFVDQDQANGNTARAIRALRLYMEAREALRGDNTSQSLDNDISFFKTKLTPHQSHNKDEDLKTDETALSGAHWTPHGQASTLGETIGYQSLKGDERHLADLFFANTPEELQMNLDAGYQGKPHLGSAALLAQIRQEEHRWITDLNELVDRSVQTEVRIILCGSAFGGTGAATLPTLAREIHQRADSSQKLSTSAVLLLPYFDFSAPSEGQDTNVASSQYLRQQTRAALDYYTRLLDTEKLFKRVYMLGWEPLFPLGYHEKGQQKQENPPLVPELFAALGASDALNDDTNNAGSNSIVAIGRNSEEEVTWSDLPENLAGLNVQKTYGKLLRFSAMWQFAYRDGIKHERDRMFAVGADAWYKRHFGSDFKKDESSHELLAKVDEYIEAFLRYAAQMAGRSRSTMVREEFKLWQHHPIGDIDFEGDPRAEVDLKGPLKDRPGDLSGLVWRLPDQPAAPSYSDVFDALSHYPMKKNANGKKAKGVVPFIEALWDVSSIETTSKET